MVVSVVKAALSRAFAASPGAKRHDRLARAGISLLGETVGFSSAFALLDDVSTTTVATPLLLAALSVLVDLLVER